MIELLQGDCLDLMKNIPDKSIDLILCDLPYGITACSWDIVLPFDKLWEHYNRIIKESGVIALFGTQPFTSIMIYNNVKSFREELVWLKNKPASGFMKEQKHMKIHENIIIFSNCSNYTYNPQKWLISEKEFITQRKTFDEIYVGNNIYSVMYRKRKVDTGERFPLSIISCRVPFTPQYNKDYKSSVDIRFHPTQKPVELLEYLIRTYTNENDIVLDNCMGSGSTGVACVNTDRNFIGIELDENYFKIASDRINQARKNRPKKLF